VIFNRVSVAAYAPGVDQNWWTTLSLPNVRFVEKDTKGLVTGECIERMSSMQAEFDHILHCLCDAPDCIQKTKASGGKVLLRCRFATNELASLSISPALVRLMADLGLDFDLSVLPLGRRGSGKRSGV